MNRATRPRDGQPPDLPRDAESLEQGRRTLSARPFLLTLISALLLVLAAPPLEWWPLGFVGLVPLYLALRAEPPGRAAGLGWLAGFLVNLLGGAWWVPVLERYGNLSLVASLGIALLICAYQGLVLAIWAGGSSLLARRASLPWIFSAPLLIILAESFVPQFFQWYLALTVWRAWPVLQVAELGGASAVSALLVLTNLVLAEVGLALWERRRPGLTPLIGGVVLLAVIGIGGLRAYQVASARQEAPKLSVGLVQPNFGILSMEDRKHRGDVYIEALRQATLTLVQDGAEMVVWPESSWPYLFDRRLQAEYPPGHPWELRPGAKVKLLFGALTHDFGDAYVYNSAVLVSESGQIMGRRDKSRLIPFAEEIPLAESFPDWAEWVRKRLPDFPAIRPGEGEQLVVDGDLRIAPIICSEELDQAVVHRAARLGPNLLVALTNDAWFGKSAAPRQHMALAALRAVETRRDLVRATNTGMSGLVDALGRVQVEGPLLEVAGDPERPTLLLAEAGLMEIFALGPYTAMFFPYASLLALAAPVILRRREKPAEAKGLKRKGRRS